MSELNTQVAGKHYIGMAIQPIVFCQRNGLNACETHAIGYIVRHAQKGGVTDIDKAIHMLRLLKEIEYGEEVQEQVRGEGEPSTEEDLPLRAGGSYVHTPSDGAPIHSRFCTQSPVTDNVRSEGEISDRRRGKKIPVDTGQ